MNSTKFVFLIAPTSAGKGFIVKLFMRVCDIMVTSKQLRIGVISFGQMIRNKLDSDPEFSQKYKSTIARGGLVDDEKAISLFDERLAEIMNVAPGDAPDIILVDGFCRSETQIQHSAQKNYLRAQDKVFIIEASFETCLQRFLHRNAHDTSRIDSEMKTFRDRYHLHADNIGKSRALLRDSDVAILDIDGNRSIAEFVFPEIFSYILAHDIASQSTIADELDESAHR